jgi:hypothetical protein
VPMRRYTRDVILYNIGMTCLDFKMVGRREERSHLAQ